MAIKDACSAVKAAKMKFRRTGQISKVKFRSRKRGDYSVVIPKKALSERGAYVTKLGELNFREFIGPVDFDCRIVLQNDRYFVIKPEKVQVKKPDNQRFPVVALDPGVRTFQTVYSPVGTAKVGQKDFARIYRLCLSLDHLHSKRARAYKSSYSKAQARIRWKIRDLISEIHHKLALLLVKSFDVVMIPSFETSIMVQKLRSKVARSMLTWAHYRFKQFLKCKAEEYSCAVLEVSEAYTSKTCSGCGKINRIGGSAILECSCGLTIDRDINGARGIFLKNLPLALKDPSEVASLVDLASQTNDSVIER